MKKFLVISAIALATFSAFCAGSKKFGKMKDSDWVVTNAWQAMQHRVKPDSEWATNHFESAEFSNAVGKVQRKVDILVKSVNGKTGDVVLNAADVHALPDTYTPPPETDPTVPAWAKQPNPPETDLTPAINYTDSATNAVMTNLTARIDKKLDKADVINPSDADESGKAADAKATKDALDGKLDTIKLYDEEYPGSGGSSLRWLGGYQGLAFGYGSSNYFHPQIKFTDTPYGEIRHVGNVNPTRPWSWITIGDSTDENTLQDALDGKADVGDIPVISATNPTFSNAVLSVGLNIDTNSVAVLNEIADTFGGFPIEGTATTVGSLLAALAAAIAWLKKNKVQTLKLEDGSIVKTAENGVAKLDDFFKESNSLLNGRLAYNRNTAGLKDRAFNALTFDGTEYNLSTALASVTPTASGQPRDLLIVATATAATTISFTAGTIKGDKPTIDGAGTWLITLTEYAANTWYCRQIKMEDAA